jgi:hypothetical protein
MELEVKVTNGTDKEIRFEIHIGGESKGELMMLRTDFTKFIDLLFGRDYSITSNKPQPID